ncbi:MAG: ornithine carbamoyltransferase [Leptospiraceae bacterium]|nr:ornithine carbamoyltransferase [Leptospiraceae bacterium]MDW7976045.1 ornithine carbamoyltransferase [Leptospiraceae bacterium]
MRHLLNLMDLDRDSFFKILHRGIEHKKNRFLNPHALKGKSIGLLFEKVSTRTRISFSVAIHELGGHYMVFSSNELQLGRGETIEDTAHVMSRYIHGLIVRTDRHEKLERMAKLNILPIINALSDLFHPCQGLADYMTMQELGFDVSKIKIAFIGEPNNVFNSLVLGSIHTNTQIAIATPSGFSLIPEVKNIITKHNKNIEIKNDPKEVVKDANVIYTDVWVSMGQEKEAETRKIIFRPYSVNSELLRYAPKDVIVMHCLPAHRGEEITNEIMDKFYHIIMNQAENRLHVQKALLEWIFGII